MGPTYSEAVKLVKQEEEEEEEEELTDGVEEHNMRSFTQISWPPLRRDLLRQLQSHKSSYSEITKAPWQDEKEESPRPLTALKKRRHRRNTGRTRPCTFSGPPPTITTTNGDSPAVSTEIPAVEPHDSKVRAKISQSVVATAASILVKLSQASSMAEEQQTVNSSPSEDSPRKMFKVLQLQEQHIITSSPPKVSPKETFNLLEWPPKRLRKPNMEFDLTHIAQADDTYAKEKEMLASMPASSIGKTGNGLLDALTSHQDKQAAAAVKSTRNVRLMRMTSVVEAAARQASSRNSPSPQKNPSKADSQRIADFIAGRAISLDSPTTPTRTRRRGFPGSPAVQTKTAIKFDHDHGNRCPSWLTVAPSFDKTSLDSQMPMADKPEVCLHIDMKGPWDSPCENPCANELETDLDSEAEKPELSLRGGGYPDGWKESLSADDYAERSLKRSGEPLNYSRPLSRATSPFFQNRQYMASVFASSKSGTPYSEHSDLAVGIISQAEASTSEDSAASYSHKDFESGLDENQYNGLRINYGLKNYIEDEEYHSGTEYWDRERNQAGYRYFGPPPGFGTPEAPSHMLFSPIDQVNHMQSKLWISREGKKCIQYQKCLANIHHLQMENSPALPQPFTFMEWVKLRAEIDESKHRHEAKKLAQKQTEHQAKRRILEMSSVPTSVPEHLAANLSNKLQDTMKVDHLTPSMARVSIWSQSLGPRGGLTDWPSYKNFKADGDERAKGRYGRFLPMPRVQNLNPKFAHLAESPNGLPTKGPDVPMEYREVCSFTVQPHLDMLVSEPEIEAARVHQTDQFNMDEIHPMTADLLGNILDEDSGFD